MNGRLPVAELLSIVKKRRSIRSYRSRPVPAKVIRKLLEAARWAPSAHNTQPWRFIVLARKEGKESLAGQMGKALRKDLTKDRAPQKIIRSKVQKSIERLRQAPLAILVCMTKEDCRLYPDRRRNRCEEEMAVMGIGAAIQNILLTVHSLGLGACWLSAPLFCPGAVRLALNIRPGWVPMALIMAGYPADIPKAPRRIPLKKMTTWIRGGKGIGRGNREKKKAAGEVGKWGNGGTKDE